MNPVMDATQWAGPLILFLLMVSVGLELSTADFRRIAKSPRAVVVGTLGQIVLLPLLTWAVVAVLDVSPVLAAGAIIVAVSPGAGISNILVAVAGANVALSVTLTAFASVLCVVTLPTIAALGMRFFLGDDVAIDVPVARLMIQLALTLLLPIGIGMLWRARRPEFVELHLRRLQRIAIVTIGLLIVLGAAFADSGEFTIADARVGMLAAAVWTLAAMAIGWGLATLAGLVHEDRFTYLIEFSTRNIAVAAIVAMSGLGRLDLALFTGAYVTIAYPMAGAFVVLRRRLARQAA
jgi:BASS family bile acid:Na+ symporter